MTNDNGKFKQRGPIKEITSVISWWRADDYDPKQKIAIHKFPLMFDSSEILIVTTQNKIRSVTLDFDEANNMFVLPKNLKESSVLAWAYWPLHFPHTLEYEEDPLRVANREEKLAKNRAEAKQFWDKVEKYRKE
jgi:hypothetical protein